MNISKFISTTIISIGISISIIMSELESLITLEYHKNRYTIAAMNYAGQSVPILLDRNIYKVIKRLNKKWYINDKNHVYCMHNVHNKSHQSSTQIYLHEIVLHLANRTQLQTQLQTKRPIIHINNIHFDNRIENLQFDVLNKDHSKNTKKKIALLICLNMELMWMTSQRIYGI